jgi:ubiquitin-protein ligase
LKWFLLIQVMASWPASPPQVQFLGPMADKAICLDAQQQAEKELHNIKSFCLGMPDAPTPQPK